MSRGSRGGRFVELRPHDLECAQLPPEPILQQRKQARESTEVSARHERAAGAAWARAQAQISPCHDPQSSLRADEQLLEIVARIVFQHPVEGAQDGSVGQHSLDSEDQTAHHSVPHDPHPAGIGRDVAADRCAAAGAEIQRKHQVMALSLLLDALQGDASLRAQCPARDVDIFDPVQSLERENQLIRAGGSAIHQASETAVRHHGLSALVTESQHARNLLRVRGANQRARIDPPYVVIVGASLERSAAEDLRVPQQGAQISDESCVGHAFYS